jgi:hypothetical protein
VQVVEHVLGELFGVLRCLPHPVADRVLVDAHGPRGASHASPLDDHLEGLNHLLPLSLDTVERRSVVLRERPVTYSASEPSEAPCGTGDAMSGDVASVPEAAHRAPAIWTGEPL